jgi:hypothetical protein
MAAHGADGPDSDDDDTMSDVFTMDGDYTLSSGMPPPPATERSHTHIPLTVESPSATRSQGLNPYSPRTDAAAYDVSTDDGSVSGIESMSGLMTTDGSYFQNDTVVHDDEMSFQAKVQAETNKILSEYDMEEDLNRSGDSKLGRYHNRTSVSAPRQAAPPMTPTSSMDDDSDSEAARARPDNQTRHSKKDPSSAVGPPPVSSNGARGSSVRHSVRSLRKQSNNKPEAPTKPAVYDLSTPETSPTNRKAPVTPQTKTPQRSNTTARPPNMIVVGSSTTTESSEKNTRSAAAIGASAAPTRKGWLGSRLSFVIIVLSIILLTAICVAVGALVAAGNRNSDSSSASSSEGGSNSGVGAPPADFLPFLPPTSAPIASEIPSTGSPTPEPSAWNRDVCGIDDPDKLVFLGEGTGDRSCEWLSGRPNVRDQFCQPGLEPFIYCRETCNNCGPAEGDTTDAPTAMPPPTSTPTSEPVMITAFPTRAPTSAPTPAPTLVATIAPVIIATPAPIAVATPPPTGTSTVGSAITNAAPASTAAALQNPASAQSRALAFVENSSATAALSESRIVQQFALATLGFRTGLAGRRLEEARQLQSWMSGTNECSWSGVTCDSQSSVIGINLSGRGLRASLPGELAMLSNLVTLDVSVNEFFGTIPTDFGRLVNLRTLRMEQNGLTGSIPNAMRNMRILREFYVEWNELTGDFPNDVVLAMSSLEELSIYHNNIAGSVSDAVCALGLDELWIDCREVNVEIGCWTRCFFQCGGSTGVAC